MAALSDAFAKRNEEFRDCSVPEIQRWLAQKGAAFPQQQRTLPPSQLIKDDTTNVCSREEDADWIIFKSSLDKIPNCMSNVYIRTILRHSKHPQEPKKNSPISNIQLEGSADALVSRGLLALVVTALSSNQTTSTTVHDNTNGHTIEDILAVDPGVVAEQFGIRRALSPGRMDGLASMMRVVQQQIQSLLDLVQEAEEDGTKQTSTAETCLFVDETKGAPIPIPSVEKDATTINNDMTTKASTTTIAAPLSAAKREASSGPSKRTVALLLSGGVDSSVALRLLLQQGYDVTAFYLKIWLEDELAHLGQCPWEDDYQVCQQVCDQAGVPLETLSLQEEYRDRVISYALHEAQRGRTPNPDILCNSRIKFGCFYKAIAERDFDHVASRHYARLVVGEPDLLAEHEEGEQRVVRLFRAPDPVKDQSYFLCALTQEQLQRVLFPIGHLEKSQVRELAEAFQLPNRQRADSQGLCFLGKIKFEDFLGAYLGERPGDIVDAATGDILGRHRGVWYHTVGQRKGIGKVLYPLATSRGPWYVVAKDPDRDIVFCSNQYDEAIFTESRSIFHVEDIQWVAGAPPATMDAGNSGRFTLKIRHGPRLVSGTLTIADTSGVEGMVELDEKDGGLAPGQYAVFYDGEECLGGGVISERHWAKFLTEHNVTTALVPNNTLVHS